MNTHLHILFEDSDIIVCEKPHGLATQSKNIRTPDLESIIKSHLASTAGSSRPPYLAVIHRLDQPVAGILVFAKTPAAAKDLNRQLTGKGFGKYYHALVDGHPCAKEGTLEHYLVKDSRTNTSRVCKKNEPGAKLARLHYKVLESQQSHSLLEIHLDTGRHHQIRVQLSSIGCPILGDQKYHPNTKEQRGNVLQLVACRLEFQHPRTKKQMHFAL